MTRREAMIELMIELRMILTHVKRAEETGRVQALAKAIDALKGPEVVNCLECEYCDTVRFLQDDARLYCRWREENGGSTDLTLDWKCPDDFCSKGFPREERRKTGELGDEK